MAQELEAEERSKILRVVILLFDGVELLDFAGPFEVFSAARPSPESPDRLMEVLTVAEDEGPISCRNGLVVMPSHSLAGCPHADLLVIPGGQGTRTAITRPGLIDWIRQRAKEATLTASVCTGSFLLAQAGLLAGKAVTTHWGSIDRLRADFPQLDVRENQRWIDAGEIVTSAGVSAGIDMALHVLERIYGTAVAAATARGIEYDHWPMRN